MENIALEIGQRCRRMRQAQGISQQELADKLGTTAQNISKYEKQGISNIEVIREVSAALGHDLLQDEMDTEGAVGEIGKEILSLIAFVHYEADELIYGKMLYGLSPDRAIRELLKLEKIGLCVREQYTTFYGETVDRVFITAKGVITLKHMNLLKMSNFNGRETYKTYENLCRGYSSIQDFIDNNPVIGITCRLDPQNGFRINLIHYLQNTLCKGHIGKAYTPQKDYFPGKGCYYDILFSMAMGITRNDADDQFADEPEIEKSGTQLLYSDPVECKFISEFRGVSGTFYEFIKARIKGENKECKRVDTVGKSDIELRFETSGIISDVLEEERKKHETDCPIDWFSTEDIRQFIENNILPPENEHEEKLHRDIIDIMTVYPETREYFVFPSSWENNGLADLVREKYGLPNWNK